MALRIVPFEPEHLDAVRRFTLSTMRRPTEDAFFAWRYLQCPTRPPAWLALQEGRCVALLGVFERPWRLGDAVMPVWETHDWFVLPEMRGSGIGVRLLQKLMAAGRPIVAWGGSTDTLTLVPRLGWGFVGEARLLVLPVAAGDLAAELVKRRNMPALVAGPAASVGVRTWFRTGRVAAPSGYAAVDVGAVGDEILDLYDGRGIVALPDPAMLRWMTSGYSGQGQATPLYFTAGGALVGWALGLVKVEATGRRAYLLELCAPGARPDALDWMVAEMVRRLRACQPDRITAYASEAPLREALARARFLDLGPLPVHLWSGKRGVAPPEVPLRVCGLVADRPLIPYAEQWPPRSPG